MARVRITGKIISIRRVNSKNIYEIVLDEATHGLDSDSENQGLLKQPPRRRVSLRELLLSVTLALILVLASYAAIKFDVVG